MLTYKLSEKNKYMSLYSHLRDDILHGRLKEGDRLPSKRALAENLALSVVTVQTAYEQLLAEGYIYSKERSGYFVADVNLDFREVKKSVLNKEEKKSDYALDFVKGGAPAELFPFSVWAKLMRRVLSECGEHLLERIPSDGDAQLKCAIADYLYRARGIETQPEYVVIGAGAEYLYGIIVQLLGRDKTFAAENPGYGAISACYKLNGANCVYVSVGKQGVSVDEVEKSGADVLHISPSHQFPTGAVTPSSVRAKLIGWANGGDRYIIEDDYDSEFRLSGKPLQCMQSLCPEKVIYMNTFSKSLAPSMRMGYMVLPSKLYEKYLKIFGKTACAVPVFEQKTLALMLDEGYFERHINRLKQRYKRLGKAVTEKVRNLFENCVVEDTGSGLHMLAYFKDAPSDDYIKKTAEKLGVRIKCVSDYFQAPSSGYERSAVINFSGITENALNSIKKNTIR